MQDLGDESGGAGVGGGPDGADGADPPVPWHFKLLVLATVAYLGLRALQGAAWLVARI